jgi:hypothetical protein
MGETRLWYSFFLPLAGLITYQTVGDTVDTVVQHPPIGTLYRCKHRPAGDPQ